MSKAFHAVYRCVQCGGGLSWTSRGAECVSCATRFEVVGTDRVDFRPRSPKAVLLEQKVGGAMPAAYLRPPGHLAAARAADPRPAAPLVPWHLSAELLSYFPRPRQVGAIALDLGCGSGVHREICEHHGFRWLGIDYAGDSATVLADAHCLPLADASVEFVLSIAVLEHLRYPAVAMREVNRVLVPGGLFIGTVAFLETFHADSFFHHSHLGTASSLLDGGFEIVAIGAVRKWSGLRAQASMGLFPRIPKPLATAIVAPTIALHKLWWWTGSLFGASASEDVRVSTNAGAFAFVGRRPAVCGS